MPHRRIKTPDEPDLFRDRPFPPALLPESRADQMLNAFLKFHAENPQVWKLFEQFSMSVASSGRKNYSSKSVFERLRWYVEFDTKGEKIKLNNNYTAYYARLFHIAHPERKGFFSNRKRISEDLKAYDIEPEVDDTSAGDEERLEEVLRRII